MSEMVEKVARALSVADGMHPEATSNDSEETPMWHLYIDNARAAIEAMREPTEAMLENTVDEHGSMRILEYTKPDERSQPFLMPRFTYRAMIDAALKE